MDRKIYIKNVAVPVVNVLINRILSISPFLMRFIVTKKKEYEGRILSLIIIYILTRKIFLIFLIFIFFALYILLCLIQ